MTSFTVPAMEQGIMDVGQRPSGAGMRRRSTVDNAGTAMNGSGIEGTLVGMGHAKTGDINDSEGAHLNIMQAFLVSFCIAFGAGIALVGWYPKLAGFWGFALVITVVSASGAVAENALHVTAIRTGASSFQELCEILPRWMGFFTTYSMIAWGFTIAGLYVRYVFTFINGQILNDYFEKEGWAAAPLYLPIGFVVYFITLPPKFSGAVVKFITNVNLATTWVVIITAMAKGLHMVYSTPSEKRPPEFEQWKPDGFLQVTVLLAGAMFQCSAVPRLQYEIQPELRERAALMIPLLLATVQGVVFLIIGFVGYWALGECVFDDGDVFNSYATIRPDWMVSILQGGIALLMFLSLPLLGVPPKSELWALLQGKSDEKVPFEDAPIAVRLGINAVMVCYATFAPMLLGSVLLTSLVTVLAGTAANWLNLFLPSFVNIYANVLPARERGEPWVGNTVKSGWIFILASASLASSVGKIIDMVQTWGETGAGDQQLTEFCEALRLLPNNTNNTDMTWIF